MAPLAGRLLALLSLAHRRPGVAAQGMADLMRIAEETKQEMLAEQRAKAAKERGFDTVDLMERAGISVNTDKTDEIRSSPDKAAQAYHEAVAETTQLVIYKEVRCEGCQLAAQLLADHLVESWKAGWNEEKALERVQLFCESESFPMGHQALIPDADPGETGVKEGDVEASKEGEAPEEKPQSQSESEAESEASGTPFDSKDGKAYVSPLDRVHGYVIEKSNVEKPATPHSLVALRRICSEGVFEHDTEIAEISVAAMAKAGEQAERQSKLQKKFEKLMCSRPCKTKSKGKDKNKASGEL